MSTDREPVAAGRASFSIDRVPQFAKAIDVAPHSPFSHSESGSELRALPMAMRLEEGEELEDTRGGIAHNCRLIHSRSC